MAVPPPQKNTTAAAATPPPPKKIPVPKKETKRWGDEEDDKPVEDTTTSSTSQQEKVAAVLNYQALAFDKNKSIVNKYLDEPQDAHIPADIPYIWANTFEDLPLSKELLKGLRTEMKFQKPSKIQAASLPMILTPPYKDFIAQAHNGSGKTTCLLLGMLSRTYRFLKPAQALCVCPTRELALQNLEVLRKMGKYTGITSECLVPVEKKNYVPISGVPPLSAQIVIGTPGTIREYILNRRLDLTYMKILVFDEADLLLDDAGFKDDSLMIKKDIEEKTSDCQLVLFYDTYNETIKNFISTVSQDYNQLYFKKGELSLHTVKQYNVCCADEDVKILVIRDRILEFTEKLGQTIIFVRTGHNAAMLHKALAELGYTVTTVLGAATPEDRDRIIQEFKNNLTKVIISTDLLSRDFDQRKVNSVINYDLPVNRDCQSVPDYAVYQHRIGWAAGFGCKGAVFNLLCGDRDEMIMAKIDGYCGTHIPEVTVKDTPYTSASTFEELNLSKELLKGLYIEMKFQKPCKIQAIGLPMILTPPHKDLIILAQNGTGKTTCFVLGMLSHIDLSVEAPQALCVCPTSELALQNLEVLRKMGTYTEITSECLVPMEKENYVPISRVPPLSAQIVIGTPGTIRKYILNGKLDLSRIKILVFDEADLMLDDAGFKDDSLRIKKDIEENTSDCQVVLFSATFNETVKNFIPRVVKDYNLLYVKKEEPSLESVKQYKVHCPDERAKVRVIRDRIFELAENLGQTIIFVQTRNNAAMLHEAFAEFDYAVDTVQGAATPEDRDKIQKFKNNLTKVLISTDLLPRRFDQQQVNLVVNYDLPVNHNYQSEPDYMVYLDRIGRAGCFGRKGAVFNLLCSDRDETIMPKIEEYFDIHIAEVNYWDNDEVFKNALKEAGL